MLTRNPLILNNDFRYALEQMEKGAQHLFITGRAGTGKSTLLQLFRNTTRKKLVVLAPTGVAALNVKGQTIHSFFGFPPRMFSQKEIRKKRNTRIYKKLEMIIIDEISMVRADLLDHIDYFLRLHRNSDLPFGGVRMVFFGDLFQLPPVVSSREEKFYFSTHYQSPYFFSSHVLQQNLFFEMVDLQEVYRQEERHFIQLLDRIRLNHLDYDDLEMLNERVEPDFGQPDFYITLSARNATVNRINQTKLDQLPSPAVHFQAAVNGQFNPRLYPTELMLSLKEGAQVMFIRNDPDRRYVNGTIGKLIHCTENKLVVVVEKDNGKTEEIQVVKDTWEIIRFKDKKQDADELQTEIVGTFTQYPLKLAWAITIHKSQGKTFDRVIIDMGRGAFEHGQTYVALSRCRTLDGIVLKRPISMRDIMVDDRIVDFYLAQR